MLRVPTVGRGGTLLLPALGESGHLRPFFILTDPVLPSAQLVTRVLTVHRFVITSR